MLFFCPHLSPLLQWIFFMWKKCSHFVYSYFSEEKSLISDYLLICRHPLLFLFLTRKATEAPGGKQALLSITALFYSGSVFVQTYLQVYLIRRTWIIYLQIYLIRNSFVCLVSWQNLAHCVHSFPGKFLHKPSQKQEPESTHSLAIPDRLSLQTPPALTQRLPHIIILCFCPSKRNRTEWTKGQKNYLAHATPLAAGGPLEAGRRQPRCSHNLAVKWA